MTVSCKAKFMNGSMKFFKIRPKLNFMKILLFVVEFIS